MQIKEGVNLAGLKIEMQPVLVAASKIWERHGQELVVTCGPGGTHSPGSLHPYGYAVDLRSRYFDSGTKIYVVESLQKELGDDYDVVSHRTHIHVEYDKILRVLLKNN